MELTLKETWSITCSTVLRVLFRVTPWNARLTARIHDHDRLPPGALRCVSEAAFCTASLENNLRSQDAYRNYRENFKIKDPCFQNAPGVTWRPVKNGRTPGEVHHVVLKLSCLWWAWNKSDFYWKTLLKYWSNFGVKCQIYEYKSSIMASNEQQYLVLRTASNNWLSARITQYITKTWRHE